MQLRSQPEQTLTEELSLLPKTEAEATTVTVTEMTETVQGVRERNPMFPKFHRTVKRRTTIRVRRFTEKSKSRKITKNKRGFPRVKIGRGVPLPILLFMGKAVKI